MKKYCSLVAIVFFIATFSYSQNKSTMKNLDESVKTYPKTFSHIGITVPNTIFTQKIR